MNKRIVILEPGKEPEVAYTPAGQTGDDELRTLQKIVGGYIELCLRGTDIVFYCNEEGHLQGLPFNFYRPTDGHPIVGTVVACGVDAAGDNRSLTDEEVKRVLVVMRSLAASRPQETSAEGSN